MRLMTANITLACTALLAAMAASGVQAQTAPGSTLEKLQKTGKVVALPVAAGQALVAGDTVVVIESMKLEHSLASPAAATVAELLVAPGQQVSPGQVLARFAPAAQGAPA